MKSMLYCTVFTTVIIGVFHYPSSLSSPINDEASQGKQARQFWPFFPFPFVGFRNPLVNYTLNHVFDANGSMIPIPSNIDLNTSYDGAFVGSSEFAYPTNFPFTFLTPFLPPVTLNMDVNATNKLNLTLQAEAGDNSTANSTTNTPSSISTALNVGTTIGKREGGWIELGNRPMEIETDDTQRARPVNEDGRRPNHSQLNSKPPSSSSVSSNLSTSSGINDNQNLPTEIQVETPQVTSALEAGDVLLAQSQGLLHLPNDVPQESLQIAAHGANSI